MLHLKNFKKNSTSHCHHTQAELRLQKDLIEISYHRLSGNCDIRISFFNSKTEFEVLISPQEGYYRYGYFLFLFKIPPSYPFQPPEVRCLTKIFHPNIDSKMGEVFLNMLKQDWKPILTINMIIFGLQLLLFFPSFHSTFLHSGFSFEHAVRLSMAGGFHFGEYWNPNIYPVSTFRRSIKRHLDINSSSSSSSSSCIEVDMETCHI